MRFHRLLIVTLGVMTCLVALAPQRTALGQTEQPASTPTGGAQRVELVNQIGGPVSAAVLLPGGSILAAEGSSLLLLAPSPTREGILDAAGRIDPGYGPIIDLEASSDFIIALTTQGLVTLSSDGIALRAVSFTPAGGQSLAVQGSLIALAARQGGLKLFRLESSGTITSLSSLPLPGGALDVAVGPDGRRAYVAAGESGVTIVDLADPAAPVVAAILSQITPAEAVAVDGKLLVVGSGGRVLTVDPDSAQPIIGQFTPLTRGQRMVIDQDFAYVADGADGLKILWLAAPDRPIQIFGESGHPASDVLIDGDTLYVAGADGLRIFNVGNRYRPLQVSGLALPAPPIRLALAPDGRIFAALGQSGVAVIDVRNLAQPQLTKLIPLPGPAQAALFDAGTLYVAAGSAGLSIISASPGGETLQTTLPLPGVAADLALRGNAVYVAADEAGLIGLDVTHPMSPIIGDILAPDPGHTISSVTISGKRAYAGQGDSFVVADTSFAGRIARLKKVIVPASMVAASDIYLYALAGNQIGIFDARATAEPVYLRAYRGLGGVAHLTASGSRVYAIPGGPGPDIVALGLQFPDSPYELDNVGETGSTGRPALSADGVILPAGFGGLRTYIVTEGGALKPQAEYDTPPEAAVLATDESQWAAGGQSGWSILDSSLATMSGRPDLDVRALALGGNRLIVASGDSRLALYSVGGPRPKLIARRDIPGPVTGLAAIPAAILAADASGLWMYDPDNLSPIRRVPTPAPANGVAVRGNLAYLPLADGSLAVVDLGDPSGGIRVIGAVEAPRPVDLIRAPDGSILALADNTLSHLVVADPQNPVLVSVATLPRAAERGFFTNGLFITLAPADSLYLFAATRLQGDVQEFNQVIAPASDIAPGWPISYAAYGDSGWGTVDLPTLSAGGLVSRDPARALLQQGNTLFVLGDELTTWNLDRPAQPQKVAELPLAAPGRAIDAALDGSLLLSLDSGLTIARWDGHSLAELGTLIAAGPVDHAAQVGKRAFLALHDGGLLVADLSDPANPVPLFTVTSPRGQFVHSLRVLDDGRLLVSWEGGIDMLDVTTHADAPPPAVVATVGVGRSPATKVALAADGTHAALGFADGHIALLDVSNPHSPTVVGQADLPQGGVLGLALDDQAIYAADGVCGLRVFGLSGPALPETGFWRGSYASDVAVAPDNAGGMQLMLADGSGLADLRYDSTRPATPPPMPQSPEPASDASHVPLNTALSWGPPADPCEPLKFDVYFGQQSDPSLLASVSGDTRLQLPPLAPLSAYYWRVEATDRQGDRVRGPLWRFTTVPADFPGVIPPSPPSFLAWMEDHPEVSTGLGALVAGLIGISLWRLTRPIRRGVRPETPPRPDRRNVPDWYSTKDDDAP